MGFNRYIFAGDSLSSISELFGFNKSRNSMMGRQSVPNFSTPIKQYAAQVSVYYSCILNLCRDTYLKPMSAAVTMGGNEAVFLKFSSFFV